MEILSEVEKEALLNEIKQIKDVLYSDRSSKKEQNDLGIEESEDDESLSGGCPTSMYFEVYLRN